MTNNMHAIELNEEQLAAVAGGYGFSSQKNVSNLWQYAQAEAAVVNVADPYITKNSFNGNAAVAITYNTANVWQENQKN